MIKRVVILSLFTFFGTRSKCQDRDISMMYGRFWSPYKYQDYGSGFRNNSASNYNFLPSVSFSKYGSGRLSTELTLLFTLYEQYYGTRLYELAYESSYGAANLLYSKGYSLLKNEMLNWRIKAGGGVGIMTGFYKESYIEMFIYPNIDSITRGTTKRNFSPVFPLLSIGTDFTVQISKNVGISLSGNYNKGFLKISEYDIYYNDGSGLNDQRAKQWGTGDFYGVQLGLRYKLKKRKVK